MEKYFDLGRAYYTYLKSSTNKDQCTVSVICDDIDIKHNIMDGLLFAGAYIYDGYQENTDGSITVCDGNISVYGCELSDLKYENYISNSNATIIKSRTIVLQNLNIIFKHVSTMTSGHKLAWTSPICAFFSRSIHSLD